MLIKVTQVIRMRAEFHALAVTNDLWGLEQGRRARPRVVPVELTASTSPLRWEDWQACLANHPDSHFADYIMQGIREGFRIGYDYTHHRCKAAKANMRSAGEHPEVVRDYIAKECSLGRLLGPFDPQALPGVHTSRFGIIPKGNSGNWRLILDLSAPEGFSVNDGIEPGLCSLSYVSVDDAAKEILRMGRGTRLAKVDIKSAYRIVPVHSEDRALLGMLWDGALYVDSVLPFGLRSAPKIFTAIADALEWRVKEEGVEVIFHYLDDFLIVAPPDSSVCEENLYKLRALFDKLHIPIAEEKLEGPTTRLTFLGIEIDTTALVLRLPREKLRDLKLLVEEWLGKKFSLVKDLQSLVGKLQHASKVVHPGRTFLRRMFDLLKGIPRKQQFVRLNVSFRSDLMWWHSFLESWNGVSMMRSQGAEPDHHLISDASGRFGCGAFWDCQWLQYQWPDGLESWSIAVKELVPIVMACALWGRKWQGSSILIHCDNEAVVSVVNAGCARETNLMHLLRCIFFVAAQFELTLTAAHIPGKDNTAADAISRNNLPLFHSQVPLAAREPSPIPAALVELLIHQQPDWMSTTWSQLFKSSLQPV